MCRLLVLDGAKRERRLVADHALRLCDTVEEVPDSKAAAKALRRNGRLPDLIVAALDAEAPDAIEVLRLRRALSLSMPVLLIVGPNAEVLVPRARSLGVQSFVSKPLGDGALDRTLRAAVDELRHE